MFEKMACGFTVVPYDSVTLNGLYLRHLNTQSHPVGLALIAPNGKAIDGEGGRPYYYGTLPKAENDAKRLNEQDDYSTCC